jgi:hypothetical protein
VGGGEALEREDRGGRQGDDQDRVHGVRLPEGIAQRNNLDRNSV